MNVAFFTTSLEITNKMQIYSHGNVMFQEVSERVNSDFEKLVTTKVGIHSLPRTVHDHLNNGTFSDGVITDIQ